MAQFLISYNIVLQKKLYMKEYRHCLVSSEILNSKIVEQQIQDKKYLQPMGDIFQETGYSYSYL